jgi:hypothetical protein
MYWQPWTGPTDENVHSILHARAVEDKRDILRGTMQQSLVTVMVTGNLAQEIHKLTASQCLQFLYSVEVSAAVALAVLTGCSTSTPSAHIRKSAQRHLSLYDRVSVCAGAKT